MNGSSSTDSRIAEQLDAVHDLVRQAAVDAGDDRTRAGILNSIDLMLRQPVQAAHLLTHRGDLPQR